MDGIMEAVINSAFWGEPRLRLFQGAGIHKQSSIKWDPNHGLKHSTERGLAHTFIVKMTPFAMQSTSTAVFFFFSRRGLAFLGESSNLFQAALLLKLWKSHAGISKGKKNPTKN